MSKTIMVADDEKRLVSLVESYLVQQGYRVVSAGNGKEALSVASREKPDLIILDVMMPEMDGYEFMREHRKEFDTPIILLTARVDDDERVIGLELGADDYITKPFRPRELLARVRAVLRRAGKVEPSAKSLRVADVFLDRDTRSVTVADRPVDLTPSEFDLLGALMTNPGRVYSRLDLLDIIQGVRYEGYERTIDTHIKNLRAKLEPEPRSPRYIRARLAISRLSTASAIVSGEARDALDHIQDGACFPWDRAGKYRPDRLAGPLDHWQRIHALYIQPAGRRSRTGTRYLLPIHRVVERSAKICHDQYRLPDFA